MLDWPFMSHCGCAFSSAEPRASESSDSHHHLYKAVHILYSHFAIHAAIAFLEINKLNKQKSRDLNECFFRITENV